MTADHRDDSYQDKTFQENNELQTYNEPTGQAQSEVHVGRLELLEERPIVNKNVWMLARSL